MHTKIEISEAIERELLSWPEVTASPHRFGGREFLVGNREIGHLHGSRVADLPFPRTVRDKLISTGQVSPHHYLPNSGWVSFHLNGEQDIPAVLALFRLNYERLHARTRRQHAGSAPAADSPLHLTAANSHE